MPRFRLLQHLPFTVTNKHGQRWRLDYRIQNESDRHVIALEHPKQTGEWWLHVFPIWEKHEAEPLIYERGVEIGRGLPE